MTARMRWLLQKNGLTQEIVAHASFTNRSHVTQVMANVPGRGGQTRKKLIRALAERAPGDLDEMLKELGWDEKGNVAGATFHGEQGEALTQCEDGECATENK